LDDRQGDGLFLPVDEQTILVERILPQFSAPDSMSLTEQWVEIERIEAMGNHVKIRYLEAASGTRAPQEINTGTLQLIHAAFHTPEGELLLAGCPQRGGNNYLVHADSGGSVSPVVELTPGNMQECAQFVFGTSGRPREATVLIFNDLIGAQLVTVQY
jgi:hypothetical protein